MTREELIEAFSRSRRFFSATAHAGEVLELAREMIGGDGGEGRGGIYRGCAGSDA